MLKIDWDVGKSRANQRKHGVTFEEAQTVFFDEDAIEFDDPQYYENETRFLIIGRSVRLRILVISYCYRKRQSVIRIISARKATNKERIYYISRGRLS